MKIIVKVFHQTEKFPIFLKTTIKLTEKDFSNKSSNIYHTKLFLHATYLQSRNQ